MGPGSLAGEGPGVQAVVGQEPGTLAAKRMSLWLYTGYSYYQG